MKTKIAAGLAFAVAVFLVTLPALAATTLYVTADNANGTNLFGKLDLKTGRFTEIAQTTPLFYALTTGADGRLYGADVNSGTLYTISRTGATISYGDITSPAFDPRNFGYGFLGLAHVGWADDFLAVNVDPKHVSLYSITKHGKKLNDLGIIEGPDTGIFFNGSLAFGPAGKLYFNFIAANGPQLYVLDPRNGAPTAVGKGLGTDVLTLFSDGVHLYGIDADATSDIGIYVIDRKTGVAVPTGVKVKGLPHSDDFYLDTATFVEDFERCE